MASVWETLYDESSGKNYYLNKETNATQWDMPVELQETTTTTSSAPPPPPPAPPVAVNMGRPEDWTEHKDPNTGAPYYHNNVTNETTWNRPAILDNATASTTQQESNDGYAMSRSTTIQSETSFNMFPSGIVGTESTAIPIEYSQARSIAPSTIVSGYGSPNPSMNMEAEREKRAKWRQYDLQKYFENHVKLHKKGLFGRMTVDQMMKHTPVLISKCMLKDLPKSEHEWAVQVFKNIVSYMGDRKSSKDPSGHIHKLSLIVLNGSDKLRDEVYLHMIRQTTNNPELKSLARGWQLMAVCSGLFPPSTQFAPYLITYIERTKDIFQQSNEKLYDCCVFILRMLEMSMKNGPRRFAPLALEVKAVEALKPIPIRIEFVDDTYKTLAVDSQSTVEDICATICDKKRIPRGPTFSLFQVARDRNTLFSERFLKPTSRVLDVVGSWLRKTALYKQQHPKAELKFTFLFKAKVVHMEHVQQSPPDVLNMYFIQGVSDVTLGRLPTTEPQAFELAALQVQAIYGSGDPGIDKIISILPDLIPKPLLEKLVPSSKKKAIKARNEIATRIIGDRQKFLQIDPADAQRHYLDFLWQNWETFGAMHFPATQVQPQDPQMKGPLTIAINERGVFLLDQQSFVLKHFMTENLVSFTHEKDSFILCSGSKLQSRKYIFDSSLAEQMYTLLNAYVNDT